jgi:ankyrin repeat protein
MFRSFVIGLCGLVLVGGCTPTATQIDNMDAKSIFADRRVAELTLAAESGDVEKIKRLSKDGVNVNCKGRYNITPILRTILKKNKEGFAALLEVGADPNVLDHNGFAAVNLAAEEEDPFWIREALAHGGNANLVNTGNRFAPGKTTLFYAISEGRVENVKLLIAAGADVNHQSQHMGRPLGQAQGSTFEIVLLLLEAGAEYRHGSYDLVENMNRTIRNDLVAVGRSEKSIEAFYKTMKFLEKKGEKFDRPVR